MLARKKIVVQKSYRIDQKAEYDLYLLAELVNRSQNELANVAIEEFLKDNGEWILQNAIVEQFSPLFEYTGEDYNHVFKMGGVEVEIDDSENYKVHYILKNGKNVIDEYEKIILISDENAENELKELLRNLGSHIDFDSEDTKKYLEKRLDYGDFVSARRKSHKISEKQ